MVWPESSLRDSSVPLVETPRLRIAGIFGISRKKIDDVATGERFAAGHTDFRYTQVGSDSNKPQCFLVGKNIFARKPFLQFLRHAVSAALVATIGDRDSQIRNAVTKSILHFDATLRLSRC